MAIHKFTRSTVTQTSILAALYLHRSSSWKRYHADALHLALRCMRYSVFRFSR